ncbi:hypothetical protein IGI04_013486, partial [Brassica rapa subsp. trilocularis]
YSRRQIKLIYQSIELGHVTQINLNYIFASSSAKSPKLHRRYLPSLLDQFPPSDHSLYPPPPPQLPTCILPAGVAFHSSGFVSSDPVRFPRSYPIVLTEGDGAKIFVRLRFGTESARMLLKLIVYHPIHTQTSVSVSSLTPPISELFGILSRRFLFFTSPQKEAGKNIHKPLWDIIAMFPLYLIAKLVNEGEVTKAETMTIGEIFDYINKRSAKVELELPTGETTFAATAELPLLSANVLSASSKGCGDLADEGMVAQITVAKHRKPNVLLMSNRSFQFLCFHAPFDLTKKKMMNVILDPIEDSTESQPEKTYSLFGMCHETLAVSLLCFCWPSEFICWTEISESSNSVGLITLTFIGDESWPHLQQYYNIIRKCKNGVCFQLL